MASQLPPEQSDQFQQGMIFMHRGQFEKAQRCLSGALDEERQTGDPSRIIPILLNLGNASASSGNRQHAAECYREVLALLKLCPDNRIAGETLVNLGNTFRENNDIERARAYYLEAADLLEEGMDDVSRGILFSNWGLLEQQAESLDDAIELFTKAIDVHKKTGNEEGLAATWGRLGRVYARIGEDKHAETCFNYASTHFFHIGDPAGEAEALRCLAGLYERRDDRELAMMCITKVFDLHRRYQLPQPDEDHVQRERLKIPSTQRP